MKKRIIFAFLFMLIFILPASANYETQETESFYLFLVYLIIAAAVCYFSSRVHVKSVRNENQKLRQQINQMYQQITQLKQSRQVNSIISLKQKIAQLEKENALLHQSIEPNQEIARLTQQNHELTDKVKRLTYQNRALHDEREDWKQKLKTAQNALPSTIRELFAERESLLDENRRLSASISALHKRYFSILGKETTTKSSELQPDIMTETSKDLSPTQLSQLALDRYIKREKDFWEVGLDYERLIGYLYEMQGYSVEYVGAVSGVKDMGRDLIVKKDTDAAIIQCKRWAKGKKIHENHILQLYGSVTLYRSQHPEISSVKGVFVTTVTLAADAKESAERLSIQVKENYPYFSHPLVKCYTSDSGKKLYSLPMEKCYDSISFSLANGDYYVKTVIEAEEAGFTSTLEA